MTTQKASPKRGFLWEFVKIEILAELTSSRSNQESRVSQDIANRKVSQTYHPSLHDRKRIKEKDSALAPKVSSSFCQASKKL
jgi:hypothetical protein